MRIVCVFILLLLGWLAPPAFAVAGQQAGTHPVSMTASSPAATTAEPACPHDCRHCDGGGVSCPSPAGCGAAVLAATGVTVTVVVVHDGSPDRPTAIFHDFLSSPPGKPPRTPA